MSYSAVLMAALVFAVYPAAAQHGHHSDGAASDSAAAADFVARARAGTEPFQHLDEAIAAGYRLVGPDFPGMGEHWVNIRLAMSKTIDPTRPAVLSYLRVDGQPVLTGAAYAVPLLPDESPPDLSFPVEWHQHGGSIADETLHLNPHAMEASPQGPQLAMIHAWVWTENPDGPFAQQNWTLPFHRLGLPVPEGITPAAGKAAHLLSGGVEYYAEVIRRAGQPADEEMSAVYDILRSSHRDVRTIIDAWAGDGIADADAVARLSRQWAATWDELFSRVGPDVVERLRPLAH